MPATLRLDDDGCVYVERPVGEEGFVGVVRPQALANTLWQLAMKARHLEKKLAAVHAELEAERKGRCLDGAGI